MVETILFPPRLPAQTWATLLLQHLRKQGKASRSEETEATHFLMSSLISESSATETYRPIFVTY